MKKFIILVLITNALLASCSPDYYLRRSQKQHQKAISKGYNPTIDTVYIADTVIVPSVRVDTLVRTLSDTITIEKEKLRVKILKRQDTLFVQAECLPDTVFQDIPVTVQETVYVEVNSLQQWYSNLPIGTKILVPIGAILLILIIVLGLAAKIVK